jgi:hypothetical protein
VTAEELEGRAFRFFVFEAARGPANERCGGGMEDWPTITLPFFFDDFFSYVFVCVPRSQSLSSSTATALSAAAGEAPGCPPDFFILAIVEYYTQSLNFGEQKQ